MAQAIQNNQSVSIHAPGRGATIPLCSSMSGMKSFNSRTREGCDAIALTQIGRQTRFNSRTREGCDPLVHSRCSHLALFQFTHPGGVRLASGQRLFL